MKNENIHTNFLNQLATGSIDFHCHGIGKFDFTEISSLNLDEIEDLLAQRNVQSILTLYLPKHEFSLFIKLLDTFSQGKQLGKYRHIKGFGLEGPLLASHGGTPQEYVWMPTMQQWQELANCGKKGLVYIILSPDAFLSGSNFAGATTSLDVPWIAETLLQGGVLPTPGHFTKLNPHASAQALQSLFDVVKSWGRGFTITDHLYNDMPNNFKHAWRTPQEKLRRNQEIELLNLESWSLNTLEENLGVVPATIIKNALKGLVKICLNFDGEHVDLAIVKKTIELVGAENILMMTDSIESKRLAGRNLRMHTNSTLLYQDEDIVAAGSQKASQQIENMLSIGLSEEQIRLITNKTPQDVVQQLEKYTVSQRQI